MTSVPGAYHRTVHHFLFAQFVAVAIAPRLPQ